MLTRAALAASVLLFAGAASAVPIQAVGDSFTVHFDGNVDGSSVPGLGASATFLVTELDVAGGRLVLQVSLANVADARFESARVSAIGFDLSGGELAAAASSGLFHDAVLGGKFPNQFGPVDVCAIDNRNNCSGGGSGGVQLGETGVVTLALSFTGPLGKLDLSNFGVRYQSLSSQALELCDASGTGHGSAVPEPRALALIGCAGLALLGRKRRA